MGGRWKRSGIDPRRRAEPPAGNPGTRQPGLPIVATTAPAPYPTATTALFMLGLLAIGVALIAGVAMRIAAISGVVMLAMMWLAEVPFAQFTSAGEPTGSPNPFADSHYIYAIVLIVLAATYAGTTWGLGRNWARLPFVHRNRWAL